MAQYLFRFRQSSETWGRLIKNPEDRSKVVAGQLEVLGGRLLGFWYTFGEHDGVVIAELPDNVAAVTFIAPMAASGAVVVETTVLLTVREMMDAFKRAATTPYRPPGA